MLSIIKLAIWRVFLWMKIDELLISDNEKKYPLKYWFYVEQGVKNMTLIISI